MRHVFLFFTLMLAACGGNTYYQGPVSDHFDGTAFFNPDRPRSHGFTDFLRWRLGWHDGPARAAWPEQAVSPFPPAKPALRMDGGRLVVTSVGHASFLIQTEGLNILTDPVWSERASPVGFAGPKRVWSAGIRMEDLPPIDVVYISHNHYDHLDIPTLHALVARAKAARHPLRIVVPLGNDAIIRGAIPDAPVEAYDWGQSTALSGTVRATLEPMQHWSARGMFDRSHALWAALVLETVHGNIYFVGDSGYGNGTWFEEHGAKYGGFRLGIFPIGAYEPRWFMSYSHMNPQEAVWAKQKSNSAFAIGHHWGAFQLTDEPREQPLHDLAAALAVEKISPATFRPLMPGESWDIPAMR